MPTAYTSNRKIGALDLATTPLAATNELVINQNGDILKTPLSAVENKIFDAKTAVTAPTGTEVVVVRQTDNSLRQVALSNIVPALNITNAQVSASAGIVDTKLATIATAGKVSNSATTATSANTNSAIVARDGSGNFSAGTITATLAGSATGNAATATNLSSNRTFALTGNVTGSTSSNLSSGVSIATTIPTGTVTSAMIADGTIVDADISASAGIVDTKLATIATAGKVSNSATTATSANTNSAIVARDGSGNFSAGTITATLAGSITGNAATATTATTLATGRTIALTGDVTGTTGSFNGSANVSAATTLANSGVVAGTYNDNAAQVRPFTVDAKGRVTSVGTAVPIALDYSVISGTPYKNNVRLATTANLTAVYANGSSGVGATLTNSGTLGALSIDGTAVALNNRILVKNQTTAAQNGIYTVTNTGSGSVAWVLTRATDADQNTEIGGAVVTVDLGTANGGKFFTTDFRSNNTVGTTAQNWSLVVTTGDTATVSTAMIADANVTTAKIADANVTTAKIADANVTTAKIADGGVTLQKLIAAVQQALVPAGAVQAFAMNSAPAGWLAADGSNVNRTTYAALFSAIGTTYGAGDGSTTFALPDLRGYFVRGSGTNSDGTAAGTFGAKQADAFKSHSHNYTDQSTNGTLLAAAGTSRTVPNVNLSSVTSAAGGTETRPKNIAMLYCIKF